MKRTRSGESAGAEGRGRADGVLAEGTLTDETPEETDQLDLFGHLLDPHDVHYPHDQHDQHDQPGRHEPRGLPARLEALARIEEAVVVGMPGMQDAEGRSATLSPGAADDLLETIEELERLREQHLRWPLGIDLLTLAEDPRRLPGMWPHLITLLADAGVTVEHAGRAITAKSLASEAAASHGGSTDLASSTDLTTCADAFSGTEVVVVQCRDEWTAADVAARYLRSEVQGGSDSSPEAEGKDEAPLHVLATTDTAVLDRALHRRGLPAVGAVDRSTDRASHQVLGLFLDVATGPVDVHLLAALLDLRVLPAMTAEGDPVGIVPAPVRRELLRALAREPGVGGAAWREALARLEERIADVEPDRQETARRAFEVAREIDRLVEDPLPGDDLRPGPIGDRLDWLAERLRAVAHRDGDLLASLTQVRTVQQVLGLLDPSAPVSRRTLQQIIDACGPAGTSALARREVAPWTVTTRPAQLPADGGTVLWWGPDADEIPTPVVWDDGEAEALVDGGARLLPPEELASLQVEAGIVGLRGARRVIAVLPGRRLEEPGRPSSLLARLETDAGQSEEDRLSPEDLISEGSWKLAGRTLPVVVPPQEHPGPFSGTVREAVDAATGAPQDLQHLLPSRLSYSQVDTLISCPHRWVLQYALDVRPAEVASLPTGPRMVGTLVHAVVEALVQESWDEELGGSRLTPPSAARIGEEFDRLVPQLASELDLPGRSAQRAEIRGRTIRSLTELFGRMAEAGWRITGTESRFELPLTLPLDGGAAPRQVLFVGSRDVDARGSDGSALILDLKWTSSLRRYADLYDSGDAIQLASYAWSVAREADGPGALQADGPGASSSIPARVGYFLLRDGEFVSADRALDPRRREELDVADAWQRMITTAAEVLDRIAGGEVPLGCRTLLEEQDLDETATYSQRTSAIRRARETARADGRVFVEDHCGIGDYAQLCGMIGDRR